jgi:ATP-dependent RNA helicase DDX19/DBP5
MLFSATYEEDVMEFAEGNTPYPVAIRLRWEEESLDNTKQYYAMCRNLEDKYTAITNIYGVITIGQAMSFCHVSCLAALTLMVIRMK